MLTSSRNSAKIRKMNHDGIPLGFKIWFGFVILMITILVGIWSSIGWVFFHVISDPNSFGHSVGHVVGSTIGGIKEGIEK